jgi:hypothetical protein
LTLRRNTDQPLAVLCESNNRRSRSCT